MFDRARLPSSLLASSLLASTLLACDPAETDAPTPDEGAIALDMAALDAATPDGDASPADAGDLDGDAPGADGFADAAGDQGPGPDAGPMVADVARYPWGPTFDADAAAAHCAGLGRGEARWWCGGRVDAADEAALADTWFAFRLTDDPCPAALGWVVETPFAGLGHPDLERVCRYRWSEAGPAPAEALPDGPHIRLEPDRQVVAAQALPAEVWQPLEQAWQIQLGLPDWSAVEAAPMTVRVAILDTSPTEPVPGGALAGTASTHGQLVGTAVRAIACPAGRGDPGPCAAELVHHLALPRVFGGSREVRGGQYGSQGEFAAALTATVADWRDDAAGGRLIVNLSLGWTALHGGDPAEGQRFVPQLGLWALDMAACDGILAVAAAGNRAAPDAVGAVYPAAWTALPSLCDPSVPPVYAVGAVDGRDLPLAVSRPGSHPRLVAPAGQVLLRDERFDDITVGTAPLSGTSLAAAAASGAAALLWAWRPELDAAQVMALLYDAGAPVEGLSELDLDGPVVRRRLDVCAALRLACEDDACAEPLPACPGRPADARADHGALVQLLFGDAPLVQGPETVAEPAVDSVDAPYATPQPNVPQCPYCGIGGGLFYGELTDVEDAELQGPVLHIDDGLDGVVIALPDLPAGQPFKVAVDYDGEIKSCRLVGQLFVGGKLVESASEIVIVQ